jgi:hypothetical protein
MRRPLLIALVLFGTRIGSHATVPSPFGPSFDTTRSQSVERSLHLLDEAYQLSHPFRLEQKAWIIFYATEVAAPIDPRRGNQWALEVWDLAKQLEPGQSRAALQKNALRDLAINDPDRALRLYRRQDLPSQWGAVHNTTEDPRSLGYANTIFKPVWERRGAPYFSRLESLARFLGATGQYPYAAMSKIALDESKSGNRHPRKILRDATKHFQRDPGFMTTNKEFVKFILATRKIASAQALRAELNAAIAALEAPPRNFAKQTWRITATTPLGNASFDSQNEALLLQLLPIVKNAMPERAPELLNRYASLRNAPAITADMPVVLTGVVSLEGTANAARMQSRADEGRLYKVQSTAEANPQEALSTAREISDPYLLTVALVSLVPAYSKVDAKEADSWLSDAKSQLGLFSDQGKKLRLMTAVVRAQVALGEDKEAEPLIQQAFDLGEAVFSLDMQGNPNELSYSIAGYDELTDLTASVVKAEVNQAATISRIARVRNDVLRATLLISAAKGILEN